MKLNLNPPKRRPAARPSAHPPTSPETRLHFSHADPDCFSSRLSALVFFFLPILRFSLDRKTPEVFLVGNSWTGMLLREQAVREESRFSGSGPTPCSAIPSLARQHRRSRVKTRSQSQETLASSGSAGSGVLVASSPPCAPPHLPVSV